MVLPTRRVSMVEEKKPPFLTPGRFAGLTHATVEHCLKCVLHPFVPRVVRGFIMRNDDDNIPILDSGTQ